MRVAVSGRLGLAGFPSETGKGVGNSDPRPLWTAPKVRWSVCVTHLSRLRYAPVARAGRSMAANK